MVKTVNFMLYLFHLLQKNGAIEQRRCLILQRKKSEQKKMPAMKYANATSLFNHISVLSKPRTCYQRRIFSIPSNAEIRIQILCKMLIYG